MSERRLLRVGHSHLHHTTCLLLVALFGLLVASGASAAITYERLTLKQGARLLVIKGEFEPADEPMKMVAEYTEFQPGFITFDSNGGSVVAVVNALGPEGPDFPSTGGHGLRQGETFVTKRPAPRRWFPTWA